MALWRFMALLFVSFLARAALLLIGAVFVFAAVICVWGVAEWAAAPFWEMFFKAIR